MSSKIPQVGPPEFSKPGQRQAAGALPPIGNLRASRSWACRQPSALDRIRAAHSIAKRIGQSASPR